MKKTAGNKKKILAVASLGGHWVQLLRIIRGLEDEYEIEFMCTDPGASVMTSGRTLYHVKDFSRWNPLRIFPATFSVIKALRASRPDAVISTGAAPGLVAITIARLMGKRTVWVDSVANAATMSGSGKVARHIAGRTYTQWPELAAGKVQYAGSIFGEDPQSSLKSEEK